MEKEELIRRLEERLARGEISEKTYLDIKARYDVMPDVPTPPEAPEPPKVPESDDSDLGSTIERAIEMAMEHAAAAVEASLGTKGELEQRMEEVRTRVKDAVSKIGAHTEAGGRRIVIRGVGKVSAAEPVDEFRSAGSGHVAGNLSAKDVRIAGACVVDGDCDCQEFHASGRAEVKGNVRAREFQSSGKAVVGGDLKAQDVSTSGKLVVGGNILDAQDVEISGAAEVGGWVRTQDFTSKGRFEIGGGLEAQDVEIRLSGTSRVPVIKAQDIEVRRGDRSGLFRNGELIVETIEGEDLDLEATRARLVRGQEVRIGPFCTIDVVEAEELEIHETSTVKERRTPKPE